MKQLIFQPLRTFVGLFRPQAQTFNPEITVPDLQKSAAVEYVEHAEMLANDSKQNRFWLPKQDVKEHKIDKSKNGKSNKPTGKKWLGKLMTPWKNVKLDPKSNIGEKSVEKKVPGTFQKKIIYLLADYVAFFLLFSIELAVRNKGNIESRHLYLCHCDGCRNF
ncbi:hypothetical protein BKA69DRAFT_131583 [Paraphysoderma sedebokerense]|nr:hypothetical protein BKA69DRAFT_131583 [Paraphysoderma sedebokerense]